MKSIYFVILLVFPATSTVQDKTLYTSAPDLIIIKSKLEYIARVDESRPHLLVRHGESPISEAPRSKDEWQGKADIEVENTGSKSIKSIEWEIFLKEGTNSETKTRRYIVRANKAIKPGDRVKLIGWIKHSSLEELRKGLSEGSLQEQAAIKRINCADGGIWTPLRSYGARRTCVETNARPACAASSEKVSCRKRCSAFDMAL